MTQPDWAQKIGERFTEKWMAGTDALDELVAKEVRAEHRRAVRIVERALLNDEVVRYENAAYCNGYREACADILAALLKGREKKGR
ncbi:MAG: hypothetical protein LZF86_140006 [Nitrospira sp.]|nr:MAG: hypothetical protein LZF86_140006 [Nitrospira sp.]